MPKRFNPNQEHQILNDVKGEPTSILQDGSEFTPKNAEDSRSRLSKFIEELPDVPTALLAMEIWCSTGVTIPVATEEALKIKEAEVVQ